MNQYFPMNCNFILNLSPDPQGRIDRNLADAFAEIGRKVQLPEPLEAIPDGWLKR